MRHDVHGQTVVYCTFASRSRSCPSQDEAEAFFHPIGSHAASTRSQSVCGSPARHDHAGSQPNRRCTYRCEFTSICSQVYLNFVWITVHLGFCHQSGAFHTVSHVLRACASRVPTEDFDCLQSSDNFFYTLLQLPAHFICTDLTIGSLVVPREDGRRIPIRISYQCCRHSKQLLPRVYQQSLQQQCHYRKVYRLVRRPVTRSL